MPHHRILVPVDGTEASRAVLPYLPMLLKSPDSEVLLVRAVPFLVTLLEIPNEFASGPPSMGSDTSQAAAQMDSLVARLRELGIRARGLARVDSPLDMVVQAIRREKIDLVALSSGASELWNFFRETLPEHILRHTTVPLFFLNARTQDPDWTVQFPWRPRSRRILVPLAGNTASEDTIGAALCLARRLGARITLEALADAESSLAQTLEQLDGALRRCEREHVPAEKRTARGDPGRVLLEETDQDEVDLIVLSPRLLPSQAADPLGSTVARLLRRVRVPMIFPARSKPTRAKGSEPELMGSAGRQTPAIAGRGAAGRR